MSESWETHYGAGTFPTTGLAVICGIYDYPYMIKNLIEYGKEKGWEGYWTGKRLREALAEIISFEGMLGKYEFDMETGLTEHNVSVIKMVPDPAKSGYYKWEEVGFYTVEEVVAMP